MDRLGLDIFTTLQIKENVLHHARAHLKVIKQVINPEGSELWFSRL